MLATNIWFWVGFVAFVLAMLALDLGVFHRKAHEVRPKEAGIWTAVWVALALLFAAGLFLLSGRQVALTFLTGYVVEATHSFSWAFGVATVFLFIGIAGYVFLLGNMAPIPDPA